MSSKKKLLLHHYAYDPLDRHVKSGGSEGPETQLFYKNNRVAVEIKGNTAYRIFETEDVALAQHIHTELDVGTTLIAHDDKRSTLATLAPAHTTAFSYTVAGYSPTDEHRVLGFNGERNDKTTGYYLLGNGYRAFNPVLMRFNSPDSWSPFGEGGINAYAYCEGDPLNRTDPEGHSWLSAIKGIGNALHLRTPSKTTDYPPFARVITTRRHNYLELRERADSKFLTKKYSHASKSTEDVHVLANDSNKMLIIEAQRKNLLETNINTALSGHKKYQQLKNELKKAEELETSIRKDVYSFNKKNDHLSNPKPNPHMADWSLAGSRVSRLKRQISLIRRETITKAERRHARRFSNQSNMADLY